MSLILSLVCSPASAAQSSSFPDVKGHPCQAAIQRWTDYGLIIGDDQGNFLPEAPLSRAAFAIILDRLMSYQVMAEDNFSDVKEGDWYRDAILRLNAAEILEGYDGKAMPLVSLTRQEAVTLTARALGISENDKALPFHDKTQVAEWAKGFISALTQRGCFSDEKDFRPSENMTRAEAVSMLDTLISAFVQTDGVYSADSKSSVIINAKNVTLKDMKIDGDLIVADGVGDGDVSLDHVTVTGQIILRGGGDHSFHLLPGTVVKGTIIVTKTTSGRIRLINESGEPLPMINVADGKDGVTLTGDFQEVVIDSNTPVDLANAKVSGTVSVTALDADVTVSGTSSVKSLEIADIAEGALISITERAKVSAVSVAADGLTLDNQNKSLKPTFIIDKNVTDKPVDPSGKEIKPSTSGGGGSGGGGSTPPQDTIILDSVNISLAAPKALKIAGNTTATGTGYVVTETEWAPALVDHRFAAATKYAATITLRTTSNNYQWGSAPLLSLPGAETIQIKQISKDTFTVLVQFPSTASTINFQYQDSHLKDVEGDSLTGFILDCPAKVLADGIIDPKYIVSYQWFQCMDPFKTDAEAIPDAINPYWWPTYPAGTYYFFCRLTTENYSEDTIVAHVTVTQYEDSNDPLPSGPLPILSDFRFTIENEELFLNCDLTDEPNFKGFEICLFKDNVQLYNNSCDISDLTTPFYITDFSYFYHSSYDFEQQLGTLYSSVGDSIDTITCRISGYDETLSDVYTIPCNISFSTQNINLEHTIHAYYDFETQSLSIEGIPDDQQSSFNLSYSIHSQDGSSLSGTIGGTLSLCNPLYPQPTEVKKLEENLETTYAFLIRKSCTENEESDFSILYEYAFLPITILDS